MNYSWKAPQSTNLRRFSRQNPTGKAAFTSCMCGKKTKHPELVFLTIQTITNINQISLCRLPIALLSGNLT